MMANTNHTVISKKNSGRLIPYIDFFKIKLKNFKSYKLNVKKCMLSMNKFTRDLPSN